jgi:hypothetical protein
MVSECKTCKFWSKWAATSGWWGLCDKFYDGTKYLDHALKVAANTRKDFGCILHEHKEVPDEH